MATLVFSAAGYAAGASLGGAVLGLSSAVIGQAVGATLGRLLDQRIMGVGSEVYRSGQVDRFRLTGASEGAPVAQVYGRMRVPGQVIWATRFAEQVTRGGGGKGAARPVEVRHSYSVSAAIALCEGEIARVGRIWADGAEIARDDLNMRVYPGDQTQLPDPRIEAVEGAGNAPAYRGIAYVVLEDLPLGRFGNRFPQLTFEVFRPAQDGVLDAELDPVNAVRAVSVIPGTGEYALATRAVHYSDGPGINRSANVNSPSNKSDFVTSMAALREELPNCKSVSLVVSWFGNDLRCGDCRIAPKVEQSEVDGTGMAWGVSGETRGSAGVVPTIGGRAAYGGTPADQSVIEAIEHIKSGGQDVVYYPFILMEQVDGNGLPDPWSDAADQPSFPWRGRITQSVAAGRAGSPDGSAVAEAEVAAFFGTAAAADFAVTAAGVVYGGPPEWSYRRFILHNAALCTAAGGVRAFLIGAEMRGLTQIRGAGGSFPAVEALRQLAADVRAILGPQVKIGYAADWSEYFGYHPQDGSGDVYFHLDPLWADDNIDFVGIDNYMPLSDWRAGEDHLDAGWGSIYNPEYLTSNIEGGEGYDWYYHSPEAAAAQIRTAISDGAHGEDWVFRYKDIRNWWGNAHHNRIGGVRQAVATGWQPGLKPIWFTELGCAAVDKGSNEPNKFVDPKSSESSLPKYSDGRRDDFIQMQYLKVMFGYWGKAANNPVSPLTGARMIDMSRAHVWTWDARPFPYFPNNRGLWSDGVNYARGHWLNGRTAARSLASVVAEICERSGVYAYDVSRLYGVVRGYAVGENGSARAALQPLMLAYGFDAVEREGLLIFRLRQGGGSTEIMRDRLVEGAGQAGDIESQRAPEAEIAGRVRLNFIEADADYEVRAAEALLPQEEALTVSQSEVPIALTAAEGQAIAERWLAESRVARDGVRFGLPMSEMRLGAGDVVSLSIGGVPGLFRIDRVEQAGLQLLEAVRVEPGLYTPGDAVEDSVSVRKFIPPVPVYPLFLDLPLLSGGEVPHVPHVAVTATPWPGSVAVYSSPSDSGYGVNRLVEDAAVIGVSRSVMPRARVGVADRGPAVRVEVFGGALESVSWEDVLNGANLAAIGDGSADNWEVFQFERAELVAPDTYDLRLRLRGQLGSDGIMPEQWPVGSRFVLLNGALKQIELPLAARGLARHYRIGPAQRGYDDPSYLHRVAAFDGIGLRPYAPCHLRLLPEGGDLRVRWIRRTRLDGDSWASFDVPLGEASEQYLLRVRNGGQILREMALGATSWVYTQADQLADGFGSGSVVEVAQISERFGPGLFAGVER